MTGAFRLRADGRLRLCENDVERQLRTFLQYRGWRLLRLLPGRYRTLDGQRVVTGPEVGTPDWLALRGHDYLLLEAKRPRAKVSLGQAVWIAQAKREGIPVWVVDSLESLVRQYRERWPGEVA